MNVDSIFDQPENLDEGQQRMVDAAQELLEVEEFVTQLKEHDNIKL